MCVVVVVVVLVVCQRHRHRLPQTPLLLRRVREKKSRISYKYKEKEERAPPARRVPSASCDHDHTITIFTSMENVLNKNPKGGVYSGLSLGQLCRHSILRRNCRGGGTSYSDLPLKLSQMESSSPDSPPVRSACLLSVVPRFQPNRSNF